MSEFIFITGGRRSGKSAYALDLAESIGKKRLYIATAEALDDEMKNRIARHQKERGDSWVTAEEPIDVAGVIEKAKGHDVILIDCLTLWLCNIMHKNVPLPSTPSREGRGSNLIEGDEEVLSRIDSLANACINNKTTVIAVTNELGLGVIPGDPLSRRYTDLAGIMNQRMAAAANRVVMTVSGIALTIKGQ
ncbi:MAG: bifunctional adenosylcobinamide kinase/adenosylcobinamide-phosphate guanylyltransferase [bacterium]|nr:bifunctional adenosylcobinamide kinase/adenosylcobinamide-phosphate guanylyltransferase [bacterium]